MGTECADRFDIPADLVFRESSSAVIHSPGGRSYDIGRNAPVALILDRAAYVNSIAESAAAAGAKYYIGYRVGEVSRSRRGVTVGALYGADGIRVSDSLRLDGTKHERQKQFEGRLLLMASGFGSTQVRMAGLGDGGGYLVGHQTEVGTEGASEVEVFVGGGDAPGSFGWLVPISDSRALLGVISSHKSQGFLHRLIDRLQREEKIAEDGCGIQSWGIPLGPIRKTYADRVLVLGDAAGFTKPVTGGGIYYSMLSGQIAAKTASEGLDSDDLSEGMLVAYEEGWKSEFGRELWMGRLTRKLFEHLDDAQIEELMEVFLGRGAWSDLINSPDFSFDRHSRAIRQILTHRHIGKSIGTFGPTAASIAGRMLRKGTLTDLFRLS